MWDEIKSFVIETHSENRGNCAIKISFSFILIFQSVNKETQLSIVFRTVTKIINGSSDLFFSRNVTIFYQESRLSLIEFWNEMTSKSKYTTTKMIKNFFS